MSLSKSKTVENLKAAFAGESQANRRYLYFAKVADVEGYPEIAANPKAQEAKRRMGPQLVAHSLMVVLIIIGNGIYYVGRKRGDV